MKIHTGFSYLVSFAVILIIHRSFSYNSRLISDPNDIDLILQKVPCIYNLCQKYFKSNHSLQGSLVIVYVTPNRSPFQRKLLTSLNEDRKYEWALMVKHSGRKHANASHVPDKAKNYFFLIKNSTEINAILVQAKTLPTWNPYAQVLILLLDDLVDEKRSIEIHKIFEILLGNEMLNVNVMYSIIGTKKIRTETWLPYGNKSCARSVRNVILMDECEINNDTVELKPIVEIGSKIPIDLNYCPLRVSVMDWPPFTIYNLGKNGFQRGIEIELLKTIGEILELKILLQYANQTRANKVNGPDFYANILEGYSDLMIGGHDENPVTRKLLSSSIPYYQDDLTWCVSKSSLAPRWSNVFAIFDTATWIGTILSIIGTGVILYQFVKHERTKNISLMWALLVAFGVSLNGRDSFYPRRTFMRIFYITLIFFGLNFNAAYQSFLISVLTKPRFDMQINSIEKAINNRFELAGGVNILTFFQKPDAISVQVRKDFQICKTVDSCLQRIKNNSRIAVAVSRKHASSIFDMDTEIYCFPHSDNIYSFSISMLSKRFFHLLPTLNEKVRLILESGFIKKWDLESRLSKIKLEKEVLKENEEELLETGRDSSSTVLKIEHVQGAFIVGAVGIILSVIGFFAELIIHRYRK